MSKAEHIKMPVRVRYRECDPMNVAHHAAYLVWLEMARTEMLRQNGHRYADLEKQGVFIVVVKLNIRYRKPARYDDELVVHCALKPCAGVKIEHAYEVRRGDEVLVTASTTVVCVNNEGKLTPVPAGLFD